MIPTQMLGDHSSFIRGLTFKPADKCAPLSSGSVVCMRTKNVQLHLDTNDLIAIPETLIKKDEKYLTAGDLLVSSANSWNLVGKCCWVPNLEYKATAGGFISILRTKESLYPRYLYWWFSSNRTQQTLRSFGNKTTNISNLDLKRALKLQIPLPPLDEQKRIAGILDAADALRAKRRQTLIELDTLIQSTFLDLFGDPVTNPKGWDFKSMNDLIVSGPQNGIYKPAKLYGSGTRILRIDGFYDGAITGETLLKRVLVSQKEQNLYCLREGDIVINRVNSPEYLGKCALIPPLLEDVIFESNMMRMSIDQATTNGRYLVQALQSKHVKNQILTSSKDAVNQSSINQKDVGSFRVPLPPLELQQQFATIVEKIEAQKARCQAQLDELDTLFASLQSRAFKGEL